MFKSRTNKWICLWVDCLSLEVLFQGHESTEMGKCDRWTLLWGSRFHYHLPLLLGASFHSIRCLLLFLPSLGTILKGGRVGSKWELADFFFSLWHEYSAHPPSRGPVFALFLLLTSIRKQSTFMLVGIPVQSLLILDLAPSGHSHMRVPHTKYPIHVQKQWVHWKSKLMGLLLLIPLLFPVKIICDFIIRI